MTFHYEVEAGEYINAGTASSKFKKTLKQIGVSPDVIRRVAVAMYEAEINMVIHAYGGEIHGLIEDDAIQVTLEDQGPGIKDVDLAMTAGYSTASDKARNMGFGAGMGLPNIKRYADDLEIESVVGQGTRVKIKVNIKD